MDCQNPKPRYNFESLMPHRSLRQPCFFCFVVVCFVLTLPFQGELSLFYPLKAFFLTHQKQSRKQEKKEKKNYQKTTFLKPISQDIYFEFLEQDPWGNVKF